MPEDAEKKLTDLAHRFLEPSNAAHRQYEALRAYFVEGIPSREACRSSRIRWSSPMPGRRVWT